MKTETFIYQINKVKDLKKMYNAENLEQVAALTSKNAKNSEGIRLGMKFVSNKVKH